LAEKVETILRRSVLNTRPRDYYDVYIIMKCQGGAIDRDIFARALTATVDKRMSMSALENRTQILQGIQADNVMRLRWDRYCRDNYYAKGIEFDEVVEAVINIISG